MIYICDGGLAPRCYLPTRWKVELNKNSQNHGRGWSNIFCLSNIHIQKLFGNKSNNLNPACHQFLGWFKLGEIATSCPALENIMHCSYRERMGLLVSNKENRYIITSLTFSALVACARWWCWTRTWWSWVELWLRWIIELASAKQSNS